MADTEYATVEQLTSFMGLLGQTIDRDANTILEEVGTGDGTRAIFVLKKQGIINGTYTFYYGENEVAALSNALTETTHYTIDLDKGYITLTSAGITLVGGNIIFSDYKYNIVGITDGESQDALNRAASEIEKKTNNRWADGTQTTPNYGQVLDEKKDGAGGWDRYYFALNRPFPVVNTLVDGDVSSGANSITVDNTDGFPSSGYLGVGNLKLTYTGKTDTTFTGVTGVSVDISDDSLVIPFVVETSNTPDGTAPTWTVNTVDNDFDINYDNGRVRLHRSTVVSTSADIIVDVSPQQGVPNRVRLSYLYGNDSIPEDITKLTLMVASQSLMHSAVRKATVEGKDDFRPNLVSVDQDDIDRIMNQHRLLLAGVRN